MVVATLERSNATTISISNLSPNSVVNVDKGDPVALGSYWERSEECTVVIKGCELMSYISDIENVCWYMLPEMKCAIERLHHVIGNAVTKDNFIVLGTGSSQVFQAALYALSPIDLPKKPVNVVSAAPYYSEYKDAVDILQSRLFQWAGDAAVYDKNEPYIEVVTSPNNPDGTLRAPVVNSMAKGKVIYDYAYYWPQFTPITHQVDDHDVMLFTFSKCTGHAGSRIGWAIVKDIEVAERMTKFVQLSSIGVSKESQIRVSKIIGVICDGYQNLKSKSIASELYFGYSKRLMRERWEKFRGAIEKSKVFTVTKYPRAYCNFSKEFSETYPCFAWLKCVEGIENAVSCMEKLKIIGRQGERFHASRKYVRISMVGTEDEFNELLMRLSNAKKE